MTRLRMLLMWALHISSPSRTFERAALRHHDRALLNAQRGGALTFLLLYVDTPFDVFASDGVPTFREALRGRFDQ